MAMKGDGREKKGSTICILVTTSPVNENSRTLTGIAKAAIGLGKNVQIFLMCDGVYHVMQKEFMSLIKAGVDVTLCSLNASQRGISKTSGVKFGSQYDLASMVSGSDCFLALT